MAKRMPISRVRLLTAYDTKPYSPTIVSAIPMTPMPPMSPVMTFPTLVTRES